jgi:PEGA domain.
MNFTYRSVFWIVLFLVISVTGVQAVQDEIVGGFLVYANVDGAGVYVDEVYKGNIIQGALFIPVYTYSPYKTFSVRKDGYTSFTGSVPRIPSAGEVISLHASLTPLEPPEIGSVYVTSSPPGAKVYIDGIFKGVSPLLVSALSSGTYKVETSVEGYIPCYQDVTVYSGQQAVVNCIMEGTSGPGIVTVISVPSGASVWIDGVYRGAAPLTLKGVAPNNHIVAVELQGYDAWKTTVNVKGGSSTTLEARLVQIPVSRNGRIVISGAPEDAEVYLDRVFSGKVPASSLFEISDAAPGSHLINIQKDGYKPYSSAITVKSGEDVALTIGMTAEDGYISGPLLQLTSKPGGANVMVDGECRGVTPLTLGEILPGRHRVNLTLPGFAEWSDEVEVKATGITEINATLTDVPLLGNSIIFGLYGAILCITLFFAGKSRKRSP